MAVAGLAGGVCDPVILDRVANLPTGGVAATCSPDGGADVASPSRSDGGSVLAGAKALRAASPCSAPNGAPSAALTPAPGAAALSPWATADGAPPGARAPAALGCDRGALMGRRHASRAPGCQSVFAAVECLAAAPLQRDGAGWTHGHPPDSRTLERSYAPSGERRLRVGGDRAVMGGRWLPRCVGLSDWWASCVKDRASCAVRPTPRNLRSRLSKRWCNRRILRLFSRERVGFARACLPAFSS